MAHWVKIALFLEALKEKLYGFYIVWEFLMVLEFLLEYLQVF